MRNLIERQLLSPAVILPMMALMELMVSRDFNFGQVGFAVAAKGARAALDLSQELFASHQTCG